MAQLRGSGPWVALVVDCCGSQRGFAPGVGVAMEVKNGAA